MELTACLGAGVGDRSAQGCVPPIMWTRIRWRFQRADGQMRARFWLSLGLVLLVVIGFVWQSWAPA